MSKFETYGEHTYNPIKSSANTRRPGAYEKKNGMQNFKSVSLVHVYVCVSNQTQRIGSFIYLNSWVWNGTGSELNTLG